MDVFQLIADSGVFGHVNAALSMLLGIGAMAAGVLGIAVPKTKRGFVLVTLGLGAVPLIIALVGVYVGHARAMGAFTIVSAEEAKRLWPTVLSELYIVAMTGPMAAMWPLSLGGGLALAPTPETRKQLRNWAPSGLVTLAGFIGSLGLMSLLLTQAYRHLFTSIIDNPAELAEVMLLLDGKAVSSWIAVGVGGILVVLGLVLSRRRPR